ncbi:MAG: N-acetylmuramoyl-L-alanine amidase [Clostridia bacterium]|nr:N-acetylmuramoyl-L-alanine amidase [Clostridia bacterium]
MRIVDLKKASPYIVIITLILTLSVVSEIIKSAYGIDLYIQSSAGTEASKIVIIDAGHGGEDAGAIGVNGKYEKDLNLEVALQIGAAFEKEGYVTVYTRTDDRMLYRPEENIKGIRKISDLKGRCRIAAQYPEALFISIHMNSFSASKYSGLQVYYSEKNTESLAIADAIQRSVKDNIQPQNNRKIKPGKDMYLLENIENPAVLIECGFLTNEEECKKLSEKEYQKELSFYIVCGIIEYMKKTEA